MKKSHGKDLAHRLTPGEPPRPPHGLIDQIKSEIPERMTYETGPRAIGGMGREVFLIAAMLLVVVGASLIAIHMMEFDAGRQGVAAIADATRSVATSSQPQAATSRMKTQSAPSASADDSTAPPAGVIAEPSMQPPPPPPPATVEAPLAAPSEPTRIATSFAPEVTAAGAAASPTPQTGIAKARPAPPAALAENEAPAADLADRDAAETRSREEEGKLAQELPVMAQAVTERSAAPAPPPSRRSRGPFSPREHAAWHDASNDPTVPLDLAIGSTSVDRVRRALERHRLPDSHEIRIEELINAFDAERAARTGDFSIVVEGGPPPRAADTRDALMRVVIRARDQRAAARKILARDATATVEFDAQIVDRYRLMRGDGGVPAPGFSATESFDAGSVTLAENDRITNLIQLRFTPEFDRRATFATVVLRYRSEADGREVEIRRPVSFAAFSRNWRTAPPALRVDAIVSLWGQLLAAAHPSQRDHSELERLATALHREHAGDPRLDDLHDLLERTIRILHGR